MPIKRSRWIRSAGLFVELRLSHPSAVQSPPVFSAPRNQSGPGPV